MSLEIFSSTPESKGLAILRLTVALVFVLAGISKLVVPEMIEAFHGQLKAANIPFEKYLILIVPIFELVIGYSLLVGRFTRYWATMSILLMSCTLYVQLLLKDPALFPYQPGKPIIPILVIALSSVLVVLGAGTWSKDLDIFEK